MGNLARRIVGIILCILGCLGYIFFGNYKGDRFPHQNLFYYFSVVVAVFGCFLWAFTIPQKMNKT